MVSKNNSSSLKPRLYTPSFILISAANLFNVSSFGFFYLFPLFIKSCKGSESDIGIIMGASAFSSVFFRPWISEMIDKIGRKKSYTLGCLITTIIPLTYLMLIGSIKELYIPLLATRFIYGIGLAICFTASFTYVADIVPKERLNEGIGMFGATGLLGLAIGPVIGEVLINRYGFNAFFIISAVIAGIGLIIDIFLPESYINKKDPNSVPFISLLRVKRIFMISFLSFCFGMVIAATGNFVSPFAKEEGLRFISFYYICYSAAAILTRLLGGRLADEFGEEKIIPYGLVLEASGLIVLSFLKNEPMLCIAGVLSGCGHGLLFPCLNSLMIRDQPAEIRGKLTGLFTGSIDAGVFIGSILLGYIGDCLGLRALFFLSAFFLLPWLFYKKPLSR